MMWENLGLGNHKIYFETLKMKEKMILWYFPGFSPSFPKVNFGIFGLWPKKTQKFQSSKSKLPIAITLLGQKTHFWKSSI